MAGLVERLRELLRQGDGEVEELWRANRARLTAFLGARQAGLIAHAIGEWNFAEALDLLDRATKNEGGGNE